MKPDPIHIRHGWWSDCADLLRMGGNYPGHAHAEFELVRLEAGEATLFHAGKRQLVRAGEVHLWWGGLPHSHSAGPQCHGLHWLTIPLEDWLGWQLDPGLTSAALAGEVLTLPSADWPLRRFKELHQLIAGGETDLGIARHECAATLLRWSRTWASHLDRSGKATAQGHNGVADRVMALLPTLVSEPLAMEDLARQVQANPRAMMTAFRKRFGLTIGDYMRSLRLAAAADQLLQTHDPVLTIATRCGFASQSRFYAAFTDHFGLAPAAFRRLGGVASV